jgi:hypothetical protein
MKNLIWVFAILTVGMLYLAGCGNNKNDNVPINTACPVNQYYSTGNCYGAGGVIQPAAYSLNAGFYADNHSGTSRITFTNSAKMKDLFKFGMGVCDRGNSNYQNLGQSNCEYYLTGSMDIIIQFAQGNTNNMIATFVAQPRVNQGLNFYGQLPSGAGLLGAALGYATGLWLPDPSYYQGAQRNPLQLQMVVSSINNSAGFEARGYGDYWTGLNRTLLTIQVPKGKVEDTNFNFNLMVGGTTAAQGIMNRCQRPNCGF